MVIEDFKKDTEEEETKLLLAALLYKLKYMQFN